MPRLCLCLTAALLACAALPAQALAPAPEEDLQSLRGAVERNELVPVASLMKWIEDRYYGRIVEVELSYQQGDVIYELDLLAPSGAKIEFEFDARDGSLISTRGRNVDAARRPDAPRATPRKAP